MGCNPKSFRARRARRTSPSQSAFRIAFSSPSSNAAALIHFPSPSSLALASLPGKLMKYFFAALCFGLMAATASAQIGGADWTSQDLTFHIHRPYNLPQESRYTEANGIIHTVVMSNDAPFSRGNTTKPRTEQRFDPDYTGGDIQYQATMMVPDTNTSGVCLFQIHTGDAQSPMYGATTFMLFWFGMDGGSLHAYSGDELTGHLAGKWFTVNCDHNLVTHLITVWIDGAEVWQQPDNGAGDFYFKDGVYAQRNDSPKMENYLRDIHIWASPGTNFPGSYQFQSRTSYMVVNVRGGSALPGAGLTQAICHDAPSSVWSFVPTDHGYYTIVNELDGLVLSLPGGPFRAGTPVIQSTYVADGRADWLPKQNRDGSYTLVNRLSNQCLHVPGDPSKPNASLDQQPPDNTSNCKWRLIPHRST